MAEAEQVWVRNIFDAVATCMPAPLTSDKHILCLLPLLTGPVCSYPQVYSPTWLAGSVKASNAS